MKKIVIKLFINWYSIQLSYVNMEKKREIYVASVSNNIS